MVFKNQPASDKEAKEPPDGNISLVDIIEEEAIEEKNFSFKSLCNHGKLIDRFLSEFKNVKIFNQFEKDKVTKKWTRKNQSFCGLSAMKSAMEFKGSNEEAM